MARKKSGEFHEEPDEAAMETEVIGVTDDPAPEEAPTVEPTLGVNVAKPEKPKAAEPTVSSSTKAEQEAGRKAVQERSGKPDETPADDTRS